MWPTIPPTTDDTINASKTLILHKHSIQSKITDIIMGFVINEIILTNLLLFHNTGNFLNSLQDVES